MVNLYTPTCSGFPNTSSATHYTMSFKKSNNSDKNTKTHSFRYQVVIFNKELSNLVFIILFYSSFKLSITNALQTGVKIAMLEKLLLNSTKI